MLYRRGLDGVGGAELRTTIGVSKETLYLHLGSIGRRNSPVSAMLASCWAGAAAMCPSATARL
ncbi:hypothetical protein ACFY1S_25635 [Micromonospora sp. NPDC000663]|uniref:hypothetical protein n=1 Tax=Micromonospora sp. NPDC000663 TaxID=3364218 RepID=UPI0036ABF540